MIRTEITLPRTRALIERGIADGLHLGAQLYVSLPDHVVVDIAVGESRPGTPMRTDDLVLWLSACKPVTAVAIMQLFERDVLRLDEPVAVHLPEFAQRGKDQLTVRHLLTHTAGIRGAAMNSNGQPWEQVIAEICAAAIEPRWVPGETTGYHGSSSWYILGELIQRISGQSFAQWIRERIFLPLRMTDSWIGMPVDAYRAYGGRIVPIYDTSKGGFDQEQFSNTESGVVMPRPAGNGRGPIRELGRFYEMLRSGGSLGNPRILSADSVAMMISRHRAGKFDKTFEHIIDWGLGFILNSDESGSISAPYGYGAYASAATFGHSGYRSSCAFCDPVRGLVVAWACNGMPSESTHQHRQRAIQAAIYEDLRLNRG